MQGLSNSPREGEENHITIGLSYRFKVVSMREGMGEIAEETLRNHEKTGKQGMICLSIPSNWDRYEQTGNIDELLWQFATEQIPLPTRDSNRCREIAEELRNSTIKKNSCRVFRNTKSSHYLSYNFSQTKKP